MKIIVTFTSLCVTNLNLNFLNMDANFRNQNYLKCLTEMYDDSMKNGELKSIRSYANAYNLTLNLCKILVNSNVIQNLNTTGRTYKWITDKPSSTTVFHVLNEQTKLSKQYTLARSKPKSDNSKGNESKLVAASNCTDYRVAIRKAYKIANKFIDEKKKEEFVDDFLKEFGTK